MMKRIHNTYFSVIAAILICVAFTGCSTTRGPSVLTPDVRQRVSHVTVSSEVSVPLSLYIPCGGGGIIGAIVCAELQRSTNNRFRSLLDFQKFVGESVYETFRRRVIERRTFECVAPDAAKTAEAEFVLEVYRLGFGPHKVFSAKMPPSIGLSVLLIGNPPCELVRSKSGQIEPLNAEKHPILYHKKALVGNADGLPYHRLSEYETNMDTFTSAFQAAIDEAVQKVLADW